MPSLSGLLNSELQDTNLLTKPFEPRCEKTDLRDFRPGPTQTSLYNHIRDRKMVRGLKFRI